LFLDNKNKLKYLSKLKNSYLIFTIKTNKVKIKTNIHASKGILFVEIKYL
jgi:hypothetical protein